MKDAILAKAFNLDLLDMLFKSQFWINCNIKQFFMMRVICAVSIFTMKSIKGGGGGGGEKKKKKIFWHQYNKEEQNALIYLRLTSFL